MKTELNRTDFPNSFEIIKLRGSSRTRTELKWNNSIILYIIKYSDDFFLILQKLSFSKNVIISNSVKRNGYAFKSYIGSEMTPFRSFLVQNSTCKVGVLNWSIYLKRHHPTVLRNCPISFHFNWQLNIEIRYLKLSIFLYPTLVFNYYIRRDQNLYMSMV